MHRAKTQLLSALAGIAFLLFNATALFAQFFTRLNRISSVLAIS